MSEHSYTPLYELDGLQCESVPIVRVRWGFALLAYLLLFFVLAMVFAMIFVPWVQTVAGAGRVTGFLANDRQQEIQAPIDGRIRHWFVMEGSRVAQGDPLLEIVDLDPNILERLTQEKHATQQKLEAARVSRDASAKNLERQKTLSEKGLSSLRSLELAQIEYQKFLGEVSSATAELARIESRLSRQSNQVLVAPRGGVVQRILVPQGEGVFVKTGAALARLVPETDALAVELKIAGNDIPLLSEGRAVRLLFEGWPAVQLPGWPSVAVGTFKGVVRIVDPSDDGTGNFRIIVVPEAPGEWPPYPFLRQGARVQGFVLLDSVSFGWELWRRLNGFPQSVPHSAKEFAAGAKGS